MIIPTLQEGKLLLGHLRQFTPELRARHRMEVIVSDGGSTDETLAHARAHADAVLEHTGTCKQTIAMGRNAGAQVARGEILVFLNADTKVDNADEFFRAIAAAMHSKRYIAATCRVFVYKEEETLADKVFHTLYNNYFWFLNIIGMGMGRGECHVVPQEVFSRAGGYNESLAAGEDFEFFVRLRQEGKIAFLRTICVRESPRRYRKYGYMKISLLWFANALSVLLFRRCIVKEWEPVR